MECLSCKLIKDLRKPGLCLLHRKKLFKLRILWKLRTKKWRQKNPKKARELNKRHQYTWRTKHPDLNRLRARLGMQKLKEKLNGSRS